MASSQMFDCVPRSRNRKENNLCFFVNDPLNITSVFPVDDSGSNKDGKRKEVLESLLTPSSNPNPTSSPLETKSGPFYDPGQPENHSRNDITMGASSLRQIWEARSQQPSSSQSQPLIDRRTSSGLSLLLNSSSFSKSLKDYAKNNNNEELDSYEKEQEGRSFLGMVTCTPRIRGKQALEEVFTKIQHDRNEELKSIANSYPVSEFSPRGRLQFMLRIRNLERCIAIQEKHQLKRRGRYKTHTGKVNGMVEARIPASPVSSREKKVGKMASKGAKKNVLEGKIEEVKETVEKTNLRETTCKTEIAKKAFVSEGTSNENGLKKPEIERVTTEEGKMSRETVEKAIAKESVEGNKTSLSIAEKVNLWESNVEATARRVAYVEATERKKEEVSSFGQGGSMGTEEYIISPHEDISVISLDKREEEETRSLVSSEIDQEEEYSQEDEETSKAEKVAALETLCLILDSPDFLSSWDESKIDAGEEEEEEYSGESEYYDWVSTISQPRSYWENLRKQWELEVMNYEESEKEDIQDMIKKRTVSRILASDLTEKINEILILQAQRRLQGERYLVEEEESLVDCSESYHEQEVEEEIVSDGFSQTSSRSVEDHALAVQVSSNPKDHENPSSEFKLTCDLKEQIKKLQIEVLELRSLAESCVDCKKFVK